LREIPPGGRGIYGNPVRRGGNPLPDARTCSTGFGDAVFLPGIAVHFGNIKPEYIPVDPYFHAIFGPQHFRLHIMKIPP
jgi:hypothetical protein